MGCSSPAQNCLFAWGSGPMVGPPESTTQTESRSIQPFLQGSQLWQTDMPTDHVVLRATIGRIYAVLRCGLIENVTCWLNIFSSMQLPVCLSQHHSNKFNKRMVKIYYTMVSCTKDLTLRSGELGGSLPVSEAYWLSDPCGVAAPTSNLLSVSVSLNTSFSVSWSVSGKVCRFR